MLINFMLMLITFIKCIVCVCFQCLSPHELLDLYKIPSQQGITEKDFKHLCPSIVYQVRVLSHSVQANDIDIRIPSQQGHTETAFSYLFFPSIIDSIR